ncbi:MAG TPA: TonB-dependent receptor [Flavisolibacter sp.]
MQWQRVCLVCITVLAGVVTAHTQSIHAVTGTLYRDEKTPAVFLPVALQTTPASKLHRSVTDQEGAFIFENVPAGAYQLLCFTGADSFIVKTFTVDSTQAQLSLGKIVVPFAKTMDEVVVTAQKQLLRTSIDRKVYFVDEDIMSRGGSASDVLKNVPSVQVDVDGEVSLRGSGEVMILINGKVSPLMGRTRAEVLQSLPAGSIERIEVITNPSARYRPDGSAGIINIVLKKNVRSGFNGTISLNAGTHDRYNGNLMVNYRPGKINLFANYGYRKDFRQRNGVSQRTYLDSGKVDYYFREVNRSIGLPTSHFAGGGFEYKPNDRITTGLSGNTFFRRFELNNVSSRTFRNKNGGLTSYYDRMRYNPETENQISGTASFKYHFGEEHDLEVELNLSRDHELEDNRFTNRHYFPSFTTFDNLLQKDTELEHQLTANYTRPMDGERVLEAGYDGLFEGVRLDFLSEYFDGTQNMFVKDVQKSNVFHYDAFIHALYGTYETNIGEVGMELGIRAEWTLLEGRQRTSGTVNKNNYLKWYPTVHLGYELADRQEVMLNYSKRVNRPDGDELNPFPEYFDPLNIFAGNPNLMPEIIHSVELGYQLQRDNFSIVPSLYYRYKKDGFAEVVQRVNDSVLMTTYTNLASNESAGLELVITGKKGSWFTTSLSANIFYNRIDAANLGYSGSSLYSMYANGVTSLALSPNTMLQLSATYRSARLTAQGKYDPSFVFNGGFRQDLFNKRVSLLFTASDIFKSNRYNSELNSPELQQQTENRRDGQVLFLGLSYRFGVLKKPKEEKLDFDDSL